MGKVKFTAKITTAARRIVPGRGQVRRALQEEFRGQLAPRILRVGRQTAPRASGALGRGLRTRVSRRGGGIGIELQSTVRSRQGFAYTGVTRFGRGPVEARRRRALAFTVNGQPIVRKRVRGYKPSHDWADDTTRAAQPHIARSAQRVGRRLQGAIG